MGTKQDKEEGTRVMNKRPDWSSIPRENREVRQSLNFFSSDVTVIGASSLIRLGVGTQLSSSANVGSHGVTHNHRSTSSQRCWTSSY